MIIQKNKKSIILGATLIAIIGISGCAANREINKVSSLSTRNDIFSETSDSKTESSKAITDINFSVKSISSRLFETYAKHSDPPFRVYLNIDGQTTILESEPVLEDSQKNHNIPESGTGWRYHFNKRIVLSPGKHKLTIEIPVDNVVVEHEIELHAGANTLTIIPVYKDKSPRRPSKYQHFSAGVKALQVLIN